MATAETMTGGDKAREKAEKDEEAILGSEEDGTVEEV
jgi:hypothetical protein